MLCQPADPNALSVRRRHGGGVSDDAFAPMVRCRKDWLASHKFTLVRLCAFRAAARGQPGGQSKGRLDLGHDLLCDNAHSLSVAVKRNDRHNRVLAQLPEAAHEKAAVAAREERNVSRPYEHSLTLRDRSRCESQV